MAETAEILDAAVAYAEELPAGFIDKMREWHPDLVALVVQYEYAPRSYKQLRRQLTFGPKPPPEQGPEEICLLCLELIRESIAKWHDSQTLPERYRLRARLRTADGGEVWRTHQLRPDFDHTGAVELIDSEGVDPQQERNALHVMAQQLEGAYAQSLRCLEAVTRSCERILGMGAAVEKMALGAAELAQKSASGLADVIRAEQEGRTAEREHEAEMAQNEVWSRIAEQFAGPIGQAVAGKWFSPGAPGASAGGVPLAQRLQDIEATAGDGWASLLKELTDDERRMLQELKQAPSDEVFLAIFAKLQQSWTQKRLATFAGLVEEYLPPAAAEALGVLVFECGQKS